MDPAVDAGDQLLLVDRGSVLREGILDPFGECPGRRRRAPGPHARPHPAASRATADRGDRGHGQDGARQFRGRALSSLSSCVDSVMEGRAECQRRVANGADPGCERTRWAGGSSISRAGIPSSRSAAGSAGYSVFPAPSTVRDGPEWYVVSQVRGSRPRLGKADVQAGFASSQGASPSRRVRKILAVSSSTPRSGSSPEAIRTRQPARLPGRHAAKAVGEGEQEAAGLAVPRQPSDRAEHGDHAASLVQPGAAPDDPETSTAPPSGHTRGPRQRCRGSPAAPRGGPARRHRRPVRDRRPSVPARRDRRRARGPPGPQARPPHSTDPTSRRPGAAAPRPPRGGRAACPASRSRASSALML